MIKISAIALTMLVGTSVGMSSYTEAQPREAHREGLTARWYPKVLQKGEEIVMEGPDRLPIDLVLEVSLLPHTPGEAPIKLVDGRTISFGFFRLLRDYRGYAGLDLPAGTKALGEFTIMEDEPSSPSALLSKVWRAMFDGGDVPPTVVTWKHLLTPDGRDFVERPHSDQDNEHLPTP